MEEHVVKILEIGFITHDVKYIRVEKPEGYKFTPGQATDVSINNATMRTKVSPFTLTGPLSAPYVEFIIKRYPAHKGVTDAIHQINVSDELILHEVFGDISYEGKGVFIAGGAGITPFIAILRDLKTKDEIEGNMLIFANKLSKDIILKEGVHVLLGSEFINILSEEKSNEFKTDL